MHFAFDDDQEMISATVKSFFAAHAPGERVREAMERKQGFDAELWRRFAQDLSLVGLAVPTGLGGAGLGAVELAIVAEAAGYQVAALPLFATMGFAIPALVAGGSAAQREEMLPRLARGELVATGTFALDLAVDNGASGVVERLPHGMAADVAVLFTADDAILVDLNATGVERRHCVTLDQTRPFARLVLTGAPFERLADAAAARTAAFDVGCLAIAADCLGGAQACLDRTLAYAKERVQFDRTIGSFQAVKHRLADMLVEIEQSRSAVYWAACALQDGAGDAGIALHSAKSICAETYGFCAGSMIQLHGGIGFSWEHDAHLFFKRAQANRTLLETPEWHRERLAGLVMEDAA